MFEIVFLMSPDKGGGSGGGQKDSGGGQKGSGEQKGGQKESEKSSPSTAGKPTGAAPRYPDRE